METGTFLHINTCSPFWSGNTNTPILVSSIAGVCDGYIQQVSLCLNQSEVDKRYNYFVHNHGSQVNEKYDRTDPLLKTC